MFISVAFFNCPTLEIYDYSTERCPGMIQSVKEIFQFEYNYLTNGAQGIGSSLHISVITCCFSHLEMSIN